MSKYIVLYEDEVIAEKTMSGLKVPQIINTTGFTKFDELQDALEYISSNGGVLLKTVSLEESA